MIVAVNSSRNDAVSDGVDSDSNYGSNSGFLGKSPESSFLGLYDDRLRRSLGRWVVVPGVGRRMVPIVRWWMVPSVRWWMVSTAWVVTLTGVVVSRCMSRRNVPSC